MCSYSCQTLKDKRVEIKTRPFLKLNVPLAPISLQTSKALPFKLHYSTFVIIISLLNQFFFVSEASNLPEDLLQIFTGGIFQPCQHGVKAAQAVCCDGNRRHIGVALLNVLAAREGGRHPR